MKLSQIILKKMVVQVRETNPYAIQLDAMLQMANLPAQEGKDENLDLQTFLTDKLNLSVVLLLNCCAEEKK